MTAIKRAGHWLADAVGAVLIALALLVITGCATEPLKPAPAVRVAVATATLSTPGTCEHAIAAEFNEVIHARRLATAMLDAGRMTVERAKLVQGVADQARAALDAACPNPQAKKPPNAEAHARAKALVPSLQFLTRVQ